MAKILVTPISASGIEPFEVSGTLTSKLIPDIGLMYYIGGSSFPAAIVEILEGKVE